MPMVRKSIAKPLRRNQLLTCMLATSIFCFTQPVSALPIEEFSADIVESHPEISQHLHYYREVVQDLEISHKGWRPSIDLDASAGTFSTKSPITNQARRSYQGNQASLTITQNLFDGLDTTYQLEQNEARISSALFRLYDTADNITLDAVRAYLEALKQRRLAELALTNVQSHQQIYNQIRNRLDSGVGRRSDTEQTEGRLARAKASLIAQQNNLHDRLTQLHKHLGRYLPAEELVEPELPPIGNGTLDEMIDLALGQHPALKSAHYNILASRADYESSKSSFMPRVDLQLQGLTGENLSGYRGPTNEYKAQIMFNYNLYDGGADLAEKRKRVSTLHQTSEFERNVRRQVIESLRLSWMARQTLEEQLSSLAKYVEQAGKTSLSYREEFLLGQRDLTDLLDAESELNSAEKSYAEARYDLLISTYRVHESIGNLFAALSLNVKVSDDGIRALQANRTYRDTLPITTDRDIDTKNDPLDHCDNTKQSTINKYGCVTSLELHLDGIKAEITPEPAQLEVVQEEPEATRDNLPEIRTDGVATIEHLNFIYKSTDLTDESQDRLDKIIEALRGIPAAKIEIHAHTDAIGSDDYNLQLSARRADAIRGHLIKGGIEKALLTAVGKGESFPIADNETEEGRALNRRVEFIVTRQDEPASETEELPLETTSEQPIEATPELVVDDYGQP